MRKRKIVIFFLLVFTSSTIFLSSISLAGNDNDKCLENRVIFDFGSGSLKVEGIIYDQCKQNQISKIGELIKPNKLSKCIINSGNNTLTKACIEQTIAYVDDSMKQFNVDCKVDKCLGIATAWARNADNSQELIDAIAGKNIKIQVLSQETEGYYGFHAAIKQYLDSLGKLQYSNKEIEKLAKNFVVFDIGGGSFQLSILDKNDKIHVYKGTHGVESFEHVLRKELGYSAQQRYPFFDHNLLNKAVDIASREIGSELKNDDIIKAAIQNYTKSSDKHVPIIAIGSVFNITVHDELQLPKVLTIDKILSTAKKFANHTIESLKLREFPRLKPAFITTAQASLITIYSIMHSVGIEKLHIVDANITDYIVSNPKFW